MLRVIFIFQPYQQFAEHNCLYHMGINNVYFPLPFHLFILYYK
uniref:Uncharacterized protein n=1 Tax=Rhizophora mucronata TaxID=61149 RepID=A0A2P2NNJ7_RHIMU